MGSTVVMPGEARLVVVQRGLRNPESGEKENERSGQLH